MNYGSSLFFLCLALAAISFGRNGKNNYFFVNFVAKNLGGGEINFVTCDNNHIINFKTLTIMRTKFNVLVVFFVGLFSVLSMVSYATISQDEKMGKPKKQKTQYVRLLGGQKTKVPKADPSVYLDIKGGSLCFNDPKHEDYVASIQAWDRIAKFDPKVGYLVTASSAKEANMSEKLYNLIKEYCEKGNKSVEYILRMG